jgi:hypothetical protein
MIHRRQGRFLGRFCGDPSVCMQCAGDKEKIYPMRYLSATARRLASVHAGDVDNPKTRAPWPA